MCIFVFYPGTCEEPNYSPEGLEYRKPKQMKLPNQAYIDLSLWKDGQKENPVEPEKWEEGTPVSPVACTPQVTPTNSLSRSPQKKKTESALYGCTMLLASVALGQDIRYLNKAQIAEELLLKEERKKRDGIFQWAPKSRSTASSSRRPPTTGEGNNNSPWVPPSSAVSLLSMPALSTKCLLQTDGEDSLEDSTHITYDPKMPTADFCPAIRGSSHELTCMPGLVTDPNRWKSHSPPSTEQACGNLPDVSSKERATCLAWTMSDENAIQTPSKTC